MSVWVTRSAPDNLSTARGLKALGRRALLVPVLTTRAVAHAEPAALPDALLFSSVHAVRHHRLGERFRGVPVFAASGAVAAAAASAGYLTITSTGGNEDALAGLIAHVLPPRSHVLLLCAERTGDSFAAQLRRAGTEVDRLTVYEPVGLDDAAIATALRRLDRIDAITIHSRTAAERLAPLIRERGWRGSLWCISPAAAAMFDGMAGVTVAVPDGPTEDAFLTMIARLGSLPSSATPSEPRLPAGFIGRSTSCAAQGVSAGNDNDCPPDYGA